MNKLSNTEKAFSAMKEAPVEMSTDAIRNIVMTTAVASVTVTKASIIARLIHTKFHLNTIIAMTSFLSASIVGSVLFFSGWHSDHSKNSSTLNSLKNSPENPQIAFNGSRPDISLAVDTPQKGKQIVIVNDANTNLPKDSNMIVRIEDNGHGKTITRIIRLDSNETMAMAMAGDSMRIPQTNMQTYTYVYSDGHDHGHKHGKDKNCIVINETHMMSMDSMQASIDAANAAVDAANASADAARASADAASAYAYSYSMNDLPKRKCMIITQTGDMDMSNFPKMDSLPNLDSLPRMDNEMMVISGSGFENMHGNRQVTVVKQGPGLGGNEMANQMVILNDSGPQVMLCGTGGMHTDSMVQKLTEKLFADKLITDQKHFTFTIDGKSMKVNGTKQSDATWNQYKTYIETISSNKVDKHFLYDLSVAGNQLRISVKNYSGN